MNESLIKTAAEFEVAFRYLESRKYTKYDSIEMIEQVNIISNHLFEPEDDDYIDGEINETKPFFFFTSKILDEPENCREMVIKELQQKEDYELLTVLTEPISDVTEKLIAELNIF